MDMLIRNKWLLLGAVGLAMGVVVGVVVPLLVSSGSSETTSVGDRLILTTEGTVYVSGDGSRIGALKDAFEEDLPLTVAAALASGYTDPVLCSIGRGKYFRREQAGVADPYFLMYDTDAELIGIYLFSETEMPAPWKRMDELLGGGTPVIDHEHWGIFLYMSDPTRACVAGDKFAAGFRQHGGGATYTGPGGVQSYQAPPTPTPTPSFGEALQTAAAKLASLTSISVSFTTEPDGLAVAEDIQPGDIGDVLKAIVEPAEAAGQWIDNISHRGISGTVMREALAGLVPSAAGDAQVTVLVWVSETGLVRQIRIEGAVDSGDPEGAVRVLDLKE